MSRRLCAMAFAGMLLSPAATAGLLEREPGQAAERHLPDDQPRTLWTYDPDTAAERASDGLAVLELARTTPETVKLKGLVPPIRFASGVADIPTSTVADLQTVLEGLADRANVRLHLVGHADDQPLSAALAARYGDNEGLSRERAAEVAEFFLAALQLGTGAVSYEWAGAKQPLASNETFAGRAENRRVEVEVWYDELTDGVAQQEVVVPTDVKRIKVCRIDTVCKLRYVDGHDKRARVQNLIAPLHYGVGNVDVTPAFVERVKRTLANLSDKRSVVVRFIGHTDARPLDARTQRVYGDHEGLSKARAWRVALAVQEQLALPTAAIDATGFGAERPAASNEGLEGQALNRRIEVEFWYDDPLQELPDEPQLCPTEAEAGIVARQYHPPWGELPRLAIVDGNIEVSPTALASVERAMRDIQDRPGVRVKLVGFTGNATLDRRTARVYGDDVGLATARARRAMEAVQAAMNLDADQVAYEGRGFLHADDPINTGFVQAQESFVAVQVVYDAHAHDDSLTGVDVRPMQRELEPENPFALNLMRITVDGEPVDDRGRSSADLQRCTDVALQNADIRFAFNNLDVERRLAVDAQPSRVVVDSGDAALAQPVAFLMHANYDHFIERAEIRVFEEGVSPRDEPWALVPLDADGAVEWFPEPGTVDLSPRRLHYVLRAYGKDGSFDETAPRGLWLVGAGDLAAEEEEAVAPPAGELLAGYGVNQLAVRNIRLSSGTVQVQGTGIPEGHDVWLAGRRVPVDERGTFIGEQILPEGAHTVELAVLDQEGAGELFLRDIAFEPRDWFYVGLADVTLSHSESSGAAELLQGDNDLDAGAYGRFAFYANGKFGDKWRLTTSIDTQEGPLDELFTNFVDKTPDALFRRIDPDYHYPSFGDDSHVQEHAPTAGKMYLKVGRRDTHALWGTFDVGYRQNELALVDRGLYGINLRHEGTAVTSFGERRFAVDGFGAEPGTMATRQEFRGTGGSLYFLRHQDLLIGSERLRVELRDPASGLVNQAFDLQPSVDYEVDYLQGTVLLAEPLASTVQDELLVRSGALSGDEAFLVVRYEYTPGFDEIDAVAVGGQAHYWITDYLKVGVTGSVNELDGVDSDLTAGQLVLRRSAATWLKVQSGENEGALSEMLASADGGFGFEAATPAPATGRTGATRVDVSLGLADFLPRREGRLTLFHQETDAGYTGSGMSMLRDTTFTGGTLALPFSERVTLTAKSDAAVQDEGLRTERHELNLAVAFNDRWELSTGVRQDVREDTTGSLATAGDLGDRTDAVLQLRYAAPSDWGVYGYVQDTVSGDELRESNRRFGLGGTYRLPGGVGVDAELSQGEDGIGGRLGTSYDVSDSTSLYLNYALEDERTDNVLRTRRGREGNLVAGAKTRISDSTSVFAERRHSENAALTGLTHATGVNYRPGNAWNVGFTTDVGNLRNRDTGAETERNATGVRFSYEHGAFSYSAGVELREDQTEEADLSVEDRETWLFRSSFRIKAGDAGRWLGKFNHSTSESSLGQFYDGGFTEASLGYALRPITNNRLNALVKYTYFYNVPSAGQVTLKDSLAEYVQKSHVAAVDLDYQLTARWSIGGKYAYRLGELSLDRDDLEFFDNRAHLYVVRSEYRLLDHWELLLEGRRLEMRDFGDSRDGALFTVSRRFGDRFRVGVGYNFTDFSSDLTDLNFDHQGVFVNLTGAL